MNQKPRIILVYTGGTIGMTRDPKSGSLIPFDFSSLLKKIPEIKGIHCDIECVWLEKPIDSSNMNPKHWIKICQKICQWYMLADGFVILHGSDTMSYTASAISFMIENLEKPIIFTGSQLPIGDLRTDAKENLITSIHIASCQENGQPIIQEVGLYFEHKLYRANRTTKINAEHFNAFVSINYPALVTSGVHLQFNRSVLLKKKEGTLNVHEKLNQNIALIKLFPGISLSWLDKALRGIQAVILETYGSGNASTEPHFLSILKKAIKNGVQIVNVTQCSGGSVDMNLYETGRKLEELGVLSGLDITTESALTKSMVLLGKNLSNNDFRREFRKSISGEMK